MNLATQLEIGLAGDCIHGAFVLPAPSRWTRQSLQFLLLRCREVLRLLATTERSEHHVFVFRAAGNATTLAWQTDFPLLVFPELFRELAEASLADACRRESVCDRRFNPWA